MSIILSLETSTDVCSVAFHQNEILLADFHLRIEKAHSRSLANIVDFGMKHTGIDKGQLSAIAVSSGPGSYTGLRIGTSFAKGMCFSLDIPLIAIDTLIGMASGINPFNASNAFLCPMIDARRMEVYCLVVDPAMNIIMKTEALVINEDSFQDLLEINEMCFFGNGASKCESMLESNKNAKFNNSFQISAADIGQLATKKFEKKEFVDVAYFEPHYLKEYIAGKPKSMI